MNYRVEIFDRKARREIKLLKAVSELGIKYVRNIVKSEIYKFSTDLSYEFIKRLADNLFDPVLQTYGIDSKKYKRSNNSNGLLKQIINSEKKAIFWVADITLKKGITDPSIEVLKRVIPEFIDIKDYKIKEITIIRRYIINADIGKKEMETITSKILANPVINNWKMERIVTS